MFVVFLVWIRSLILTTNASPQATKKRFADVQNQTAISTQNACILRTMTCSGARYQRLPHRRIAPHHTCRNTTRIHQPVRQQQPEPAVAAARASNSSSQSQQQQQPEPPAAAARASSGSSQSQKQQQPEPAAAAARASSSGSQSQQKQQQPEPAAEAANVVPGERCPLICIAFCPSFIETKLVGTV